MEYNCWDNGFKIRLEFDNLSLIFLFFVSDSLHGVYLIV